MPRADKQTCACASDLGDASHVTCSLCTLLGRVTFAGSYSFVERKVNSEDDINNAFRKFNSRRNSELVGSTSLGSGHCFLCDWQVETEICRVGSQQWTRGHLSS